MPTPAYITPAGRLRHPITVQSPSTVKGSFGELTPGGWTTVLTTRADITTLTTNEKYQAQQFTSEVSHRIKFRWPGADATLKPGYQILFAGAGANHTYIVQAIENVEERNRLMSVLALEINATE